MSQDKKQFYIRHKLNLWKRWQAYLDMGDGQAMYRIEQRISRVNATIASLRAA